VATAGKIDPMHQFMIAPMGGDRLAASPFQFTNSALWMLIVLGAIVWFMWGGLKRELVPGRWQSVAEMLYEFVADMVDSNIGQGGRRFFPFIFTLFTFILFANLLGMIPYSYTTTSQIIVTFALAAVVFILVTTIGIVRHGFHFLSLFVPHGVPKALLLLLVTVKVGLAIPVFRVITPLLIEEPLAPLSASIFWSRVAMSSVTLIRFGVELLAPEVTKVRVLAPAVPLTWI